MLKNIFKANLFIILSASIIPISYLVGNSYYHGILSVYGLSPDAFPVAASELYMFAYGFITLKFASWWNDLYQFIVNSIGFVLVGVLLLVGFIGFLVYLVKAEETDTFPAWLYWLKKAFDPKANSMSLTLFASFQLMKIIAQLFYLATTVVFVLALLLSIPFKDAKELTVETRQIYLAKGCYVDKDNYWNNCHSLLSKQGSVIAKGLLVAQSTSRVAFFTDKGVKIYSIPVDAVIFREFKLNKEGTS